MYPLGGYTSPGSELTVIDDPDKMPRHTTQANVNTNQGYQDLSVFLPAQMRMDDIPPAAPKAKIVSPFVKVMAAGIIIFIIWKIWR